MENNYNPFTLMFGKMPQTLINRVDIVNEIAGGFNIEPSQFQTYLISGVRGSGKTVLMTTVEKILSDEGDWIVADLNTNQNLISDCASRLSYACKKMPNFLEKGLDVSAFGFGIGIGGTGEEKDDIDVIENILRYAKKRNKKVLITIDEVVNNENMRLFASQFQIFARKEYPIYLMMTGLYENIYSIQNDPALTFLLRSPKTFLGPLNLKVIADKYHELLNIPMDDARVLSKLTKGYAFAFQALGVVMYKAGKERDKDEVLREFDALLDECVYKKVWSSLTDKEQEIVLEMANSDKEKSIKDIRESVGMSPQSFNTYKNRLMGKGVIMSSSRGTIELSLPRFSEIIKEYVYFE